MEMEIKAETLNNTEVEIVFHEMKNMYDLVSKYIDKNIKKRYYYCTKFTVVTENSYVGNIMIEDIISIKMRNS